MDLAVAAVAAWTLAAAWGDQSRSDSYWSPVRPKFAVALDLASWIGDARWVLRDRGECWNA